MRENERLNKMLTIMSDRAPSSTLELLSARLQIKHYLGRALDGQTAAKQDRKWREVRPIATEMMKVCLENHSGSPGV